MISFGKTFTKNLNISHATYLEWSLRLNLKVATEPMGHLRKSASNGKNDIVAFQKLLLPCRITGKFSVD